MVVVIVMLYTMHYAASMISPERTNVSRRPCLFLLSEMPENYLVLRPVGQIVAVRGNCGKFPGL